MTGPAPGGMMAAVGNTLEGLITRASYEPGDETYDAVLLALRGVQVFSPMPKGWDAKGPVQLATCSVGPMTRALRFYTSQAHPHLGAPHAGMAWEAIVEMVAKVPDIDGVQVVNDADDWVAFGRDVLRKS